MFKKTGVLSVVVALIVLGLCVAPCSAQNNVGSVTKRGSLLIFPKILTIGETDTIVTIGNDYSAAVSVKCYWMDSDQQSWDFVFTLTAYQPVWFRASDGVGSIEINGFGERKQGELKCWAIKELADPDNPGGTIENQISWNYLYGSAMIIAGGLPSAFEYPAFAFAARNVARGEPVITSPDTVPGTLVLNGSSIDIGYDACPSYLVFNFFAEDNIEDGSMPIGESDLALVPCKQDFRQDNGPICSKVKFEIWNENELKHTGAYQCIKCFFEGVLSEIGTKIWPECDLADYGGKCKYTGVGGKKFTSGTLKTDLGRFRVTPDTFAACKGVFAKMGQDGKTPVDVCGDSADQYKTPFLGLLITEMLFENAGIETRIFGTTPTLVGAWTAGGTVQPVPGIFWDPGVGDSPAPKR